MIKLLSATLLLGVSLSVTAAQEGSQSQPKPHQATTKAPKESAEKSDHNKKSDSQSDPKEKSDTKKISPQKVVAKASKDSKKDNSENDDSSEDSSDMFEDVEVNDPLEKMNRGLYYINAGLDYALIKPLALGYRKVVPEMVRDRVDDFLTNLRSPISFVNHILQGEPKRALTTLSTFVINSTFGFLGLYDTAKDIGISSIETNFNETLGRWGIDTGPYLIVPILGSSSFRGVAGLGADYMTDPVTLYLYLHGPYRDTVTIGSYIR
ncbi:MAG TPA: MlaA family lipoprotein, partial [Candidatus Nitrosotenuis sp.]|nr:MlaA family lipoprotein [Candidatus Nitrosotenuis sp.]